MKSPERKRTKISSTQDHDHHHHQQQLPSYGDDHPHSKLEIELEVKSLRRIISAYLNYADAAEQDVVRYERCYDKLSPAHKALLSQHPLKCQQLRRCISENSFFILNMLQAFEPPLDMSVGTCDHKHIEDVPNNFFSSERCYSFGHSAPTSGRTSFPETDQATCGEDCYATCKSAEGRDSNHEVPMFSDTANGGWTLNTISNKESRIDGSIDVKERDDQEAIVSVSNSSSNVNSSMYPWLDPSLQVKVPLADVDKVRCIIRNIVRDWAAEGREERDQCYAPILAELDRLFPSRSKDRPPCCLVPGAGLGRLALEISSLGFASEGNEFSYYMMICSSFILNQTQVPEEWKIYPWIHSNCNSLSDNDQLRGVSFPDIHPASAGITEGFSMCGGDFVEVYSDFSHEGAWDAVATCFFLDTAHNIVEYIEIISRILRSGGVWINLGPLLYHFADAYGTEDEMSIELSLEDVKKVAFHYGFELEQEKTIETTYTANPRSMMQNRYYAAFWTMRKKEKL
ncbi:carnosine N-methyltransferase [Ranunculus cassubicifolius]